jgi:glycosyltransferase involved in cell wall biosynthesis
MRITVGICTWNRASLLDRALESFQRLVVPERVEWELIVVDNNSTDDTAAVLNRHLGSVPLRPLFEARQGKSVSCNTLLAAATGDLILWTDDDACPDPQWMVAMHRAFMEHRADLVFGAVRPAWLAPVPRWFGPRFWGNFALLDYGDAPFIVTDDDHPFYGVNYGIRTSVLRSIGGFREDIGPVHEAGGGEDIELYVRARAANVRMAYDPSVIVGHMIEPWRCTRSFHRRRTWRGSTPYFKTLLTDLPAVPRVLHVPRYMYRQAIEHAGAYVKATLTGNTSEQFFRELKLIQFAGLIVNGVKHRDAPDSPRR